MIEDKEFVQLRQSEAITDFAVLIQEVGAKTVAREFSRGFPKQCNELTYEIANLRREVRLAALLKA